MAIKPRILTIEDNPENRLLVQRILMAEGFELLTAGKLRSYSFTTPKSDKPKRIYHRKHRVH